MYTADNVFYPTGLSVTLDFYKDLSLVISSLAPYFCSPDRHSGGNLENMNNQETKLRSHITWLQPQTSTLHPYLLCPHDLRCQIAFVVPKEVCHLKIRSKRKCPEHRSCCLRRTLAYLTY